jgi:hypothetical protein
MKILVLLLSICPTLTAFAQNPENPVRPQPFIRIERAGQATGLSFFLFSTNDHHYTIRHDGLAESNFLEKHHRRTFRLPVSRGARLERVYVAEFQDDLLLAFEVTHGGWGWAYVARLNERARKFRWTTPITGINLGPGLIEEGSVYLTAQNLLARLDLNSGNYIWQREVDKDATAFAEFQLPEINGERAIFYENGQRRRMIEIDKLTGEIRKLSSASIPPR